ncbi:MFS transporter [Zhongshania sp.]|uniref:MFS transporter n=1 Tax=Zhongshania sp. TaxID=1971902 RepID=UPI0035685201
MSLSKNGVSEWRGFWFLPLVAALGYATSVLHVYSFGPFIGPIQAEFDWSRAQVSSGISIAAFLSAIFCIPVGMLIDRIGPRRVGLFGVLAMSGTVALLSTATGEQGNWVLMWAVVAFGTLCVQATVWTTAVNSRFEASRGMALAVTLSGASFAATLFPLLATWLIENYGWRNAFTGLGGIWAALVFPILLFSFRGAQDVKIVTTNGEVKPEIVLTGLSLAEGLRSPALYKLVLASALFAFTAVGTIVHFVPILTDRGAEPLAAAGIASLIGVFSIFGRLGTGFLLDRAPAHIVGACVCLMPIAASALLIIDGASAVNQILAAAIFGLTLGSEVDVIAYLAARHFGLKNFASLYGALIMSLAIGTSFGPVSAGAVFDQYDSYAPFLVFTAIIMAVSSISILSLEPFGRKAKTIVHTP